MVEVGKKVKATLFNGGIVEGVVRRIVPLYEGGIEGGLYTAITWPPKKQVGTRYYIECPHCLNETPVDVYATVYETLEEVEECS